VGTQNRRVKQATDKLPDWAERIPQIRTALDNVRAVYIDRRRIAELFGVSSYRARSLIHSMGPMLHGNSLVVDGADIRKMLSEVEKDKEIRDLRRHLAEKDASSNGHVGR